MDETDAAPQVSTEPPGWQPLPTRARALFALTWLPLALPVAVAGFVLATLADARWPVVIALLAALPGAGLGVWFGLRQYRYSFWRHDREGLAVRHGHWWQRETRVPASRVQHLDLKRGPLQRRRALATLVVHTAGTTHNTISVHHLDEDDAQRLREALSAQIDHDDDD